MSEIKEAVIISAVRTPVGKFLGALKGFKAAELGAIAVREAVKRLELSHGGKPVGGLTVSLGVALSPYHADQATTLLRKADEALYRAKDAGRDRVVVSDAGAAPRSEATPKSRSAPAS